jgi:hypothetical protein
VPQASRHFGTSIAAEMLDIIHMFRIKKQIGYFTLDNAENNTTTMEVIGGELGFIGLMRRSRCIGHTVNLAAKALLFGKDHDAFEERFDGQSPLTIAEYQRWRAKGPVSKLHNLVVDVRNVHRLSSLFEKIQERDRQQKSYRLILDSNIRWLSQLYMIRRALELKTSLRMLLLEAREEWNKENWSLRINKVPPSRLARIPRYL